MIVNSRDTLKQYCLRDLGAPVVRINVDDGQLEDRLDEAIEYFHIFHYDGLELMYLKHKITTTDITNQWIPLPDQIYGIVRVIPITSQLSANMSIFDVQYQFMMNEVFNLTSMSIINYNNLKNHLADLNFILNNQEIIRFNRYTDKLYLDINWGMNISVDQYILVECYRALDPIENSKMYNDRWLKKYVSALFKKQWGSNLKKFGGMILPGGITLNGDDMYNEAITEKESLEDELKKSAPPMGIFVG